MDGASFEGKQSEVILFGTGRLGSLLGQEIIQLGCCDRLFLENRSKSKLQGVALSLQIFASIIGSRVVVDVLENGDLKGVDLVVIAIKEEYDPRALLKRERLPAGFDRNVRTIGIKRDLPLIANVCARLRGFRGRVLLLTNPVDVFTVFVKQWLPTAEVYGLGLSLDSARLAFVASKEGRSCKASDCPLGGIHIGRPVPLRSLWNKDSEIAHHTDEGITDLLEIAMGLGPKIVDYLGFTLNDCAAAFSRDVAWFSGYPCDRPVVCASVGDTAGAVGMPLVYDSEGGSIEQLRLIAADEALEIAAGRGRIEKLVDLIRSNPYFGFKDLATQV